MTANEVVIAAGAVVAVILLALAVLACLAALATAAFDRLAPLPSPDVRLTDAQVAALCEDERMETLRRQLDEIWSDEEDPRNAFADAVLDCWEWIDRLPERRTS